MSRRQVFVISPIGEAGSEVRRRADQVLRHIIFPTMTQCGFNEDEVVRADTISKPGAITQQIVSAIINADLIIADLTGLNANVFYELAIRHFINKPYVQICDVNTLIPFDIKDQRTIMFDYKDLDSVEVTKKQLAQFTRSAIEEPGSCINPFQAVLNTENYLRSEKENKEKIEHLSDSFTTVTHQVNEIVSKMTNDEYLVQQALQDRYRHSEIAYLQQQEAERNSLTEQIKYGKCDVGSSVMHPHYGIGRVDKINSGNFGAEITVSFPNVSKTVSFQVTSAPLTLVEE